MYLPRMSMAVAPRPMLSALEADACEWTFRCPVLAGGPSDASTEASSFPKPAHSGSDWKTPDQCIPPILDVSIYVGESIEEVYHALDFVGKSSPAPTSVPTPVPTHVPDSLIRHYIDADCGTCLAEADVLVDFFSQPDHDLYVPSVTLESRAVDAGSVTTPAPTSVPTPVRTYVPDFLIRHYIDIDCCPWTAVADVFDDTLSQPDQDYYVPSAALASLAGDAGSRMSTPAPTSVPTPVPTHVPDSLLRHYISVECCSLMAEADELVDTVCQPDQDLIVPPAALACHAVDAGAGISTPALTPVPTPVPTHVPDFLIRHHIGVDCCSSLAEADVLVDSFCQPDEDLYVPSVTLDSHAVNAGSGMTSPAPTSAQPPVLTHVPDFLIRHFIDDDCCSWTAEADMLDDTLSQPDQVFFVPSAAMDSRAGDAGPGMSTPAPTSVPTPVPIHVSDSLIRHHISVDCRTSMAEADVLVDTLSQPDKLLAEAEKLLADSGRRQSDRLMAEALALLARTAHSDRRDEACLDLVCDASDGTEDTAVQSLGAAHVATGAAPGAVMDPDRGGARVSPSRVCATPGAVMDPDRGGARRSFAYGSGDVASLVGSPDASDMGAAPGAEPLSRRFRKRRFRRAHR